MLRAFWPTRKTCAGSLGKQNYSLGFVNKTGHDLVAVSANYGKEEVAAPGRLVRAGRATEGPVPLPIPSVAEVRWEENGIRHSVNVKLEGVVPKGFTRGTIYFILKADGTVDAKAIKREDIDANVHVGE